MSDPVVVKPVPFIKNPMAKKYAIPAVAALLLIGYFLLKPSEGTDPKDIAAESARVATQEQLANLKAAGVIVAPTQPPAPKPQPDYDFLTCTHTVPSDRECVPYNPQPLTTEAKELIGWQGGVRGGALMRDITRDLVNQIRRMPGVPACDLYLGLAPVKDPARPDSTPLDRTVHASQAVAPPGAVKMYDCTPIAPETRITVPTAGSS